MDYLLLDLKDEDAMSLLLRCCPDAHAAIRLPTKVCAILPRALCILHTQCSSQKFSGLSVSSSEEDFDDDNDPR